jgi:hypothetical protein
MVKIIHKECGGVAFFYDHRPTRGEAGPLARHATLLNGEKPQPADLVVCGSCGKQPSLVESFEPEGGYA